MNILLSPENISSTIFYKPAHLHKEHMWDQDASQTSTTIYQKQCKLAGHRRADLMGD